MAENFNQMLFDEEIETDNTQTQASGSSQQVKLFRFSNFY